MIAKIECYFLAEERTEITISDRVYFYGVYIATGAALTVATFGAWF